MSQELRFPLSNAALLPETIKELRLERFDEFCDYVRDLPYGRVSRPSDVFSVLTEKRGTCSAKHRLLAAVAHACGRLDIQLTIGIYAMSELNTPGVGPILDAAGFPSIPEAHCYLTSKGRRYDYTGLEAGSMSPYDVLISETVIDPEYLAETKEPLHRKAIDDWAIAHNVDPAKAWAVREACIAKLMANNLLPPPVCAGR